MNKNVLPYSQWAELPKRKAAPSAGTRQNKRREEFRESFKYVSLRYSGEPRAARRRMARAIAKRMHTAAAAA